MALQTDKVLAGFAVNCMESPDFCPLAHRFELASDLQAGIIAFLQALKSRPINIPGIGPVDYSTAKSTILTDLYGDWMGLATQLDQSMEAMNVQNSHAATNWKRDMYTQPIDIKRRDDVAHLIPEVWESLAGIHCSDRTNRATSLNQLKPGILASWSLGYMADYNDVTTLECAQWKFDAKERYNGNFSTKPANPVLLVGNTFDPVTPLASAYNVSSSFVDSVVLEHNGYGVSFFFFFFFFFVCVCLCE